MSTYLVTNNLDSGPGSLRDAIMLANVDPESTIIFSVTGIIELTSGELQIARSMTIKGPVLIC